MPAWVVAAPAPATATETQPLPAVSGRRELAFEQQSNYLLPRPQTFLRLRAVALEASALGGVSQPQIQFNPAYQTVIVHSVSVSRDGQVQDRLKDARIELMRREQRLEQQIVDGNETLLVVVPDVRVGEAVELTYTIDGENPIFEGRIATAIGAGFDLPLDLLHWRVLAPADRPLQVRALAGAPEPMLSVDPAGHQVLSLVRHRVPAVLGEQGTPPWVKAYPSVHVSEYRSWAEVDAWARRLFALPAVVHPAVSARAAEFRATGLEGAALVSEVLRFVQDEVRYFSVSLGESSHRPKAPETTLADRLGDCKDKTLLLVALLRELGFDARPALVSNARHRGLAQFLPGPEQFDHVITALQWDGQRWMLDATASGQGLTLATRGQWDHGLALVVGGDGELVEARERGDASNRIEFEQRWDFTRPGAAARLQTVMRAHGLHAERWRAGAASGGAERIGQSLTAGFARAYPALQADGSAEIQDDRQSNVFTVTMRFLHPDAGRYKEGVLEFEVGAVELVDALGGPSEMKRRTPWHLDQPRLVDSRISIEAPIAFRITNLPPIQELGPRQLRYSYKVGVQGPSLRFERRVERRSDEVLPGDLESYREQVLRARQTLSNSLRLPLVDLQQMQDAARQIEARLRSTRGWRDDQLGSILMRNEWARYLDGRVLLQAESGSALARQVMSSRAVAHNLLGDFAAGLADAEAALALAPDNEDALDAQAVALLGGARPGPTGEVLDAALAVFQRLAERHERKAPVLSWIGAIQVMQGRGEAAEAVLREALDKATGTEREFILIWLYLAAELRAGQGAEAVAPHGESVSADKLTGGILRYFVGIVSREELLSRAAKPSAMARLNLSEAYFFIGAQALVRGQREDALRSFRRAVDQGAVPYREHTFAELELRRQR